MMTRFPDEAKLAVLFQIKKGAVVGCAVDP